MRRKVVYPQGRYALYIVLDEGRGGRGVDEYHTRSGREAELYRYTGEATYSMMEPLLPEDGEVDPVNEVPLGDSEGWASWSRLLMARARLEPIISSRFLCDPRDGST